MKTLDQHLRQHNIMTKVAMGIYGILMAIHYATSNYQAMVMLLLAIVWMWCWSKEVTDRLNFTKETTALLEQLKKINEDRGH